MPLENDFTRVYGAIKELEERVEALELEDASDKRHIAHLKLVGGVARSATEGVMTLIDENDQLRFILSILAAVKDDGWIEWHGNNNSPIKNTVKVDVRFRDGWELTAHRPEQLRWYHLTHPRDIIAYRIAR
jgi:hypothetical protein